MAEDKPSSQPAKDVRYDWIQERVCSSLKVREEQFQKLLQGETKWVLCCYGTLQCCVLLLCYLCAEAMHSAGTGCTS